MDILNTIKDKQDEIVLLGAVVSIVALGATALMTAKGYIEKYTQR